MSAGISEVDQRAVRVRYVGCALDDPLPRFTTLKQWRVRAQELRTHILSVTGLLPMPEGPPLRAQMFETIEYPDYAVSKVFFQSHPGLLVTGNLFVPRGRKGPFPAVLNPHGHWNTGRMENSDLVSTLGRGLTFARQGYVALCYDMVGYNDSTQLPHDFRTLNQEGDDRLQLWGLNMMGLQLYNSIRAVDFLQSLPIVDPERIGCTGESGGGTQTFMLTSVEDRIKVSAPVNMIAASFQGGCSCENAPTLRINTTNLEIAALMAPRPMLLVAATGDWTATTPTVEYPFVQSIYQLYSAADRVEVALVDADHNYNRVSRNAVYKFFGKWLLGVDDADALLEQPFQLETETKYLVFANRKRPSYAPAGEKLIGKLIQQRKRAIKRIWPTSKRELRSFQQQMAPALKHLLMAEVPQPGKIKAVSHGKAKLGRVTIEELILTRPSVGDRVPALLLKPPTKQSKRSVVLAVSSERRETLVNQETGEFGAVVGGLLAAGQMVLIVDCWGTGHARIPPQRDERTKEVEFYLTYHRSDDVERVQDILTGLGYLRSKRSIERISLVGFGHAGLWAFLARTQAPFIKQTVLDLARFRADQDKSFRQHLLVPTLQSIDGLTTAAALIAPDPLCLHNLGAGLDLNAIAQAYQAAGREGALYVKKKALSEEGIVQRLC